MVGVRGLPAGFSLSIATLSGSIREKNQPGAFNVQFGELVSISRGTF